MNIMNIHIGDMDTSHLDEVTTLYVDSVHRHFKNTLPDEELYMWTHEGEKRQFKEQLETRSMTLRVALADTGECIGFTRIGRDCDHPDLGWIDLIFVQDRWQRKGIGARLFQDAAAILKGQGFETMHLWTSSLGTSHQFYLHLAGSPAGRKINDIQFDLTEYTWKL